MIKTETVVSDLIEKIKSNDYFKESKIIHAFPNSVRKTVLKNIIIALGIKEFLSEKTYLGESGENGKCSVFADVFIPFSLGMESAEKIITEICKSLDSFSIVSISVLEPKANEMAECFYFRCVITFLDEITFGGDTDE